jgi:hypothetical protein
MPSSILNSDDGVISGTSGLKSSGGDDGVLVFQSKGTETARINTDKQIEAAAGTVSLPSITTTGDVNTGIFFPAADTIAFSEGGVERMRIDSSGQLMLGTATSTNTLSVDIQNKSASSNNVFVQIKNTTNNEDVGLIINGLSSSIAYEYQQGMNIVAATPDFCFRAMTASTAYRYYFDSTESVRINQYGIGLGANTSPSSGIGITFPASASASSDANTLDDYEEGNTYHRLSTGKYTKIGRQVTVTFYIVWTAHTGTGDISSQRFRIWKY